MTLTDDETQRLYGMGGPCEHWVVRSRYLTPDEVAVVADACISELLTELVHGSRLAARWCDERSDALLAAERAETDAMRLKALADERWEKCEHETAMREQAEAANEKWNAANIAANRTIDSLVRERRTLRRLKQRAERERDRLNPRIAELEAELERERRHLSWERARVSQECARLAACGAAALGYSDGSDIHSDYHSASLDDVLALRARCEQAEAEVERRTHQLTLAIAVMCDNCLAEWKREMRAEQDVPLEEGG